MNIDINIIKLLLNKNIYIKYNKYINLDYYKNNSKEVFKILLCLFELHSQKEGDLSLNDLAMFFYTQYPLLINKPDEKFLIDAIFLQIENADVSEDVAVGYLKKHREQALATEYAINFLDVSQGKMEMSDAVAGIDTSDFDFNEGTTDLFVTDDLSILTDQLYSSQGLRWRLLTLNKSLGSLRKGDFGFIYARPESFSRDTEVLTPEGWIAVDNVTTDTYIAQVNPDLTTTFVQPNAVHPHEQTHCYHIYDTLGRVDLIVTEGHGMIYEKDGKLWKERADTMKYYQGIKHHVSAASSLKDGVDFLPEHRLLIAYQADGHTRNYKEYGYTFSFKKKRKHARLKEILSQCKYEYSEYKDGNRGHRGYYVKSKIRLVKNFDWINLSLVSKEWCQQFIEELSYWDATRRTDSRFKYDTVDFNVASKVQAIAILAGYNCLLSTHIDNRSPNYSDIYSLSIRTTYQPVDGQSIQKDLIPFTDTTYCFEVPSGMLLVRRNGAVAVSGNTGKTTFLASEVTCMAVQAKQLGLGPVLWLNNEEQGSKVMLRCYQAHFGIETNELYANLEKYKKLFEEDLGGYLKIYDSAKITAQEVEQMCKDLNPSLIIFDQLDKIVWKDGERYDLKMKAIYQWARELSKSYAPFIAVCQAGGTAENKKYLEMNDVDSSHTAKQGEADFMMGIGKTNAEAEEFTRFISISKNKLTGDVDSNQDLRHMKAPLRIHPKIARYEDMLKL